MLIRTLDTQHPPGCQTLLAGTFTRSRRSSDPRVPGQEGVHSLCASSQRDHGGLGGPHRPDIEERGLLNSGSSCALILTADLAVKSSTNSKMKSSGERQEDL